LIALEPGERTVPAMLARRAELDGDRVLLRHGDLVRTAHEVRHVAAAMAGSLRAAGIAAGDRVATLCGNRIELLDLILGCAWLGATVVPLNAAARGRQLAHMLTNSGARAVAVDPELLSVLPAEPPPALEVVWVLDGAAQPEPAGYRTAPLPPLEDPIDPAAVAPGDTLAILYTSGTTGPSKGVLCPQAQFYWWGVGVGEILELGPGDLLHTCLPLFHTNAINAFTQALVSGAVYSFAPRFSASGFWDELARVGATVTYLLGAMISILWRREPGPGDRAHDVRVALAPATPAAVHEHFFERFGVRLIEGYGSTETNCVIGAQPDEQRPGYMGYVRDGYEALVVDEYDEPVEDGEPGELVARCREPFSFATGYHEMPEKTVEAWRNLWFHTGDRVVREDDGWFRFLDRLKDAIRRRGENISSLEVEQALGEHPAVEAVAVFPVPSELGEDEVMAAVVPSEGERISPEELIGHCEERLAYFAIPRYIDFVDRLPMTENGKVLKVRLRERGVTETTWDREAAGYELKR
jgi:carnitine-CoA ligase